MYAVQQGKQRSQEVTGDFRRSRTHCFCLLFLCNLQIPSWMQQEPFNLQKVELFTGQNLAAKVHTAGTSLDQQEANQPVVAQHHKGQA